MGSVLPAFAAAAPSSSARWGEGGGDGAAMVVEEKEEYKCNGAENINIAEAIICGSDEVLPFITSVISEHRTDYYEQAMTEQLEYYNRAMREQLEYYNQLESKLEEEQIGKTRKRRRKEVDDKAKLQKEINIQQSILQQIQQKINIQESIIRGFPSSAAAHDPRRKIIRYTEFINLLNDVVVSKKKIENVYTALSIGFNAYMYSYLQDICNTSNDMTIVNALACLPNEMKLLIYITNLVEGEYGGIDFDQIW